MNAVPRTRSTTGTAPARPSVLRTAALRSERAVPVAQSSVDVIRSNDEIVRLFTLADGIQLNDSLLEELSRYKITSRDLARPGEFKYGVNVKFQNPRGDLLSIIEASLKIQAYRDRTTEIQLELLGFKYKLQNIYRIGADLIRTLYHDLLKSRGGLDQQKMFIGAVLDPVSQKILQIDHQIKQIEAVLDNLDKAHYTYKGVGDLAEKVLSRMEGAGTVLRAPSRNA